MEHQHDPHKPPHPPQRVHPSIQDVADEAGVSIATVSRVLNSPNLVAPATASRVRQAVEKLGYVPNAFAQGLITRASKVLALALPDIHGEFYSELLRGADGAAKALGYHLLVASAQGTPADADMGLGPVLGLVDGIALMVTEPNDALLKRAASARIPAVVLDAPDPHHADSITVDNHAGATQATEHLLSLVSPRDAYFAGGPPENYDSKTRAQAFLETLKAHGNHVPADHVASGSFSFEWGERFARGLIKDGRLRGAGILAGNDEIAYGIIHAAEAEGLIPPRDFVIVGFDDTRLASLIRPTLSSVRVPMSDAGAKAVGLLVNRIKNPNLPPQRVSLTPTLVPRQTTASAPARPRPPAR
ncbi:MAG: LacI family DNA-binding transcriptional regulator [Phycisphaeraceae bacterium]|nr:MAG: LacI family DNA-binding transcriptional regulator [Phycisphaeraceae bacterium]